MRVPPEVESLIWAIAEDPTERAVQEFHRRYPIYAGELARRIATVRALKGAGRETPHVRPGFTPPPPRFATGRGSSWAAGLALAAVAVASFTFAVLARKPVEPPPAPPEPMAIRVVTPPKPDPFVLPPVDPDPSPQSNPGPGDVPPAGEESPRWAKPQRVEMRGVQLVTALQAVAAQGGLKIVIGPGLPNPRIDVSYHGLNTVEVLQRMGAEYAFTPFDQGDGSIIIVPARDDDAQEGDGSPELRKVERKPAQGPS